MAQLQTTKYFQDELYYILEQIISVDIEKYKMKLIKY